MTSVRVKIDVPAGLIELEGEKEFVGSYLDKLLPLVEAVGFGANGRSEDAPGEDTSSFSPSEPASGENGSSETPKKKRKVPKRPPAGASCRDRILILRGDGFFKEHRSPTDIVAGLAKKGWTHKANQVSAALTTMFSNGEVQRTKADDGPGYTYFWDRH